MRTIKCSRCGCEFSESDGNPAIHYSTPASICWRCDVFEKLKPGDWYQDASGNYRQKGTGDKAQEAQGHD